MNKLIFRKIFIFSQTEKKARCIEFSEKSNIITSSAFEGNDRGKSIIMKSLFHCIGADCKFDSKWNDSNKIYILEMEYKNKTYFVFRYNSLFKIFDSEKNLLAKTVNRNELSELLNAIFEFSVLLPNRTEDKLEVAPPAFNYLLYFLDQDNQDGTKFESFKSLAQYPNYKENLLFYHFGAYDEIYFNAVKEIEVLKQQFLDFTKEQQLLDSMLDKIVVDLKDVSYSKNIDTLRISVEKSKEEYSKIANSLSKTKNKLISLRNEKYQLQEDVKMLRLMSKENENCITSLNKNVCPECHTELEDTTVLRISKYNLSDDILLLSADMQISLTQVERDIQKQEDVYREWLNKLNQYEEKLNIGSKEISDVLKHKGYEEMRDNLVKEFGSLKTKITQNQDEQKELQKAIRKYTEIKNNINSKYKELMLSTKISLGLEEIIESDFNKVTKNFVAGGSNKPISTVAWYINLIKLKHLFNPTTINFPIVFDSPANAEVDTDKKLQVYKFIVDNVNTEDNQLIVSGIGYNQEEFEGITFDKVIELDNPKYELLKSEAYSAYESLLVALNNA